MDKNGPESEPGKLNMTEFLEEKEDMSDSNIANVMRHVKKLCSGEGIIYKGWLKGTVFKKGEHVNLAMDFDRMLDDARDFENENGEDKGHGWLLRHSITKLTTTRDMSFKRSFDAR